MVNFDVNLSDVADLGDILVINCLSYLYCDTCGWHIDKNWSIGFIW